MTVSTTIRSAVLATNGATTVFSYSFKVLDESHLTVQLRNTTTKAVEKTYTSGEYTVAGIGTDSGSVTISPAPATGKEIYIERTLPYTQDIDIVNQGGFFPDVIEGQLDRTTMQIQQIASDAERAVKVPEGETGLVLESASQRANQLLGFDESGNPVAANLVVTTVEGGAVSSRILLANIADPVEGQVVYLAEAGRSGWFIWSSVDRSAQVTLDTQQGIYVPPTSDATGASGAWVRQYSGLASVKFFGAVGDGVTDDTTALLAAAAMGVGIEFPPGDYVFTGEFRTSAPMVKGVAATILHQPAEDNLDCIECTSDHAVIETLTVKNLGSTSADKTTRDAFSMRGDRGAIRSCTVFGAFHDTRIEASIGASGSNAPLMSIYNAFVSTSSNFVRIENCKAFDGFYTAFRFHESDQGRAVGGVARNGYRGYMISGDDVSEFSTTCKIDGIEFEQIIEMGGKIEVGCANSGVTGCTFTNCLNGLELGSGASHLFLSQAQGSYFIDNDIDCTNIDDGSQVLIRVGASGGNFGDGSVITDNRIHNATKEVADAGYFVIQVLNCEGVRNSNNTMENVEGTGIYHSSCENSIVTINTIKNPSNRGIQWDNEVSGTYSLNTVESAGGDGFRCSEGAVGNTHSCTITSNTARNCGDRGFEFNRLQNCVITGNTENGSTGTGMFVQLSEHCQIKNNIADNFDFASNANSNEADNIAHAA